MRYQIMARNKDGKEFECFIWTRGSTEGILRAWRDAKDFGIELEHVWSVELPQEEEPE